MRDELRFDFLNAVIGQGKHGHVPPGTTVLLLFFLKIFDNGRIPGSFRCPLSFQLDKTHFRNPLRCAPVFLRGSLRLRFLPALKKIFNKLVEK